MLNSVALLCRQESHHLLGWGTATDGIDFLPPLSRLKQDPHRVEAGDSICTCDYGCEAFDVRRKGRQIPEDALVLQR